MFTGKLGLQQRVYPEYRRAFFTRLGERCTQGMQIFAGDPRDSEAITPTFDVQAMQLQRAENVHLLGGSLYFCWQRDILSWLEECDPNVVVFEANPRCLSNDRAVTWMRQRGRPVIGWGLGAPPLKGLGTRLRLRRRRRYITGFDALIAYSQRGAQEYEQIGFPPDRIFVAYNAVAPAPETVPIHSPAIDRKVEVLFVGRLQARKRVDQLIKACKQLESSVALTVIGDGPARAGLEALASEVFPMTRFVGEVHGEGLEPYYQQADLFVLPGTGGLAVQEAMAHGLPVIVSEGDGTQEDLVSNENGWLIPPGDDQALLKALNLALQDPTSLLEMGQRSFELVRERFNIDVMADAFIAALNTVSRRE